MASILFVYPPTADPTGPYLSIPYLVAAVRARGHRAAVADLNLEGWSWLLRPAVLERFAADCAARLEKFAGQELDFRDASECLALSSVAGDAAEVAARIDDAQATLRDPERFFDPAAYDEAYRVVERALALISARFHPLELTFTAWRSPFHLNDAAEIAREGGPDENPFFATYLDTLLPRLERERPDVVGISATFNAQLLQAFTIGRLVKERFPQAHVTIGGTAATQLVLRAEPDVLRSLAPFADSFALFEGESLLPDLLERVASGARPLDLVNVVEPSREPFTFEKRPTAEPLDEHPTPDYSDLPLARYLSPEPMLYLAPTRGCYWEKCAFCHYGLTDAGTAPYRRRAVVRFVADLEELQRRHGVRYFYFAGDLIDPRYMQELAEAILAKGLDVRFTSDLRIERSFTAERCRRLKEAGLVAAAFGTESDSPRLLALIEKGTDPAANRQVFRNFAEAGVAVQAMTFIDFPTETADEARATLDLLEENQDRIDLFFVEEFDLEAGSAVYREPAKYGVKEVFYPDGDRLRLRARFVLERESKRPDEYQDLLERMDRLADAYGRRPYPWAGSVSVAHTQFYFDRHGRDVFKRLRALERLREGVHREPRSLRAATPRLAAGVALGELPYDLGRLAGHVARAATRVEERRTMERRDFGRAVWRSLASEVRPFRGAETFHLFPRLGPPLPMPPWAWKFVSCLDGETRVDEAAERVDVPLREACKVVEALLARHDLELPVEAPAG